MPLYAPSTASKIGTAGISSQPAPVTTTQIGGKDSTGDLVALSVSPTGVLNVSFPVVGTDIAIYGALPTGAYNSPTVLVSYTVPVGKTFYLKNAEVSGENKATYELRHVATPTTPTGTVAIRRTYYTEFNTDFIFDDTTDGLPCADPDIVTIMVTNTSASNAAFNATIYGRLV